jgi:hypothetical protein
MSRREAWLTAGAVFLVALAVRVWAGSLVVFPKPEDTAYYVMVARNLLDGHGLVADALWSYQTPPLVFPRPAFEVWLPLPTFLAAIPMAILGSTFEAARWSSIVVGSLVPVLAWRLAADVAAGRGLAATRARTLAIGAGLTTAVSLSVVLHSALPDSTMPFAVLALAAGILMARISTMPGNARADLLGDARTVRWLDGRLLALGACLGLAALTRNEAAWLALTWLIVAAFTPNTTRSERFRLVAVPAIVSIAIFAPWAIRDWIVFGSPLPGQAATNALSVTGFDIFAWNDPPTVERYLAVGPQALLEMRFVGLEHNLVSVLLLPGMPTALIGLISLPWQGRDLALRPIVLFSAMTFSVTSLAFPVATTWGTFLHAAGPVHVLLIVAAVFGLDALISRIGRIRGWSRPVAWLGPALTVSAGLLFLVALFPAFGDGTAGTLRQYQAIEASLVAAGEPLGPDGPPIITDFPIWLADATGNPALALPDESPSDVLDLAETFGAEILLVAQAGNPDAHGRWPGVLEGIGPGADDPAVACFTPLALPVPADPVLAAAFGEVRAWRIGCAAALAD